jgi:hypothetical protein
MPKENGQQENSSTEQAHHMNHAILSREPVLVSFNAMFQFDARSFNRK